MALLTRSWPALAVWGSALLHLSLGASLTLGTGRPVATVVAVGLLLVGVTELAWGAAALRAGRPVAPRTAAVGAVLSIAAGGAALATGCSPLAVAAAVLLTLGAGAALARSERASAERPAPTASARPWVATVGSVAGAVIVAALVTPALSTVYVPGADAPAPSTQLGPHAGH